MLRWSRLGGWQRFAIDFTFSCCTLHLCLPSHSFKGLYANCLSLIPYYSFHILSLRYGHVSSTSPCRFAGLEHSWRVSSRSANILTTAIYPYVQGYANLQQIFQYRPHHTSSQRLQKPLVDLQSITKAQSPRFKFPVPQQLQQNLEYGTRLSQCLLLLADCPVYRSIQARSRNRIKRA